MVDRQMKVTTDKLMGDLRAVMGDSQELIKELAGELSERGKQARARLMATLESARETCDGLQDKAKAGAEKADMMVREHPYSSIGVAFAVGLLIGVMVGRK
jgi:ElaB/YqjD/DUF883 family membrane-anchored ribosome-binding protein